MNFITRHPKLISPLRVNFKRALIDDEMDIVDMIKIILTAKGFDVIIDMRGLNVTNLVNLHKPHLVLLDIRLPGKSGTEICKN